MEIAELAWRGIMTRLRKGRGASTGDPSFSVILARRGKSGVSADARAFSRK